MKGETFLKLFATYHSAATNSESKIIQAKFELALSKVGSLEDMEDMLNRMKAELDGFTEKTRISALILVRRADELISNMIRKEAELVRWISRLQRK